MMQVFLRHMDNATYRYRRETRMLILLLVRGPSFCPAGVLGYPDESRLIALARRNKVEYLLTHFSDCSACRVRAGRRMKQEIRTVRRRTVAALLYRQGMLADIHRAAKRMRIRAVAFKQIPATFEAPGSSGLMHGGNDLDILMTVSEGEMLAAEYRAAGYEKTRFGARKEFQMKHPAHGFEIDIHHLVAHPHYDALRGGELRKIADFSSALLAASPVGLSVLSPRDYLVTLSVRFWYNDMLCGLRDLFLLARFMERSSPATRRETLHRARRHNVVNELLWMLCVAERLLAIPMRHELRRLTPLRIRLSSYGVSVEDIAVFPSISDWHRTGTSPGMRRRHTRYGVLRLLVGNDVGVMRLLRPSIISYAGRSLLRLAAERLSPLGRTPGLGV